MRVHSFDLTMRHRPEVEEIKQAVGNPAEYSQVVFCGFGESTLRLDVLLEVSEWVKLHGGSTRLNTDGLANLVHGRNVLPEMESKIDALSVSLNAQEEGLYNRLCQPRLSGSYGAMIDFLKEAPRYVPDVTATAIEGLTGVDIDACRRLAEKLRVQFRPRALDVVG
tara:strand:- start:694 stop:1191 length:498 start_codon:yes stop_codon:yes gene_type:complete